jgi:S1-C subfamily serine protease
MLDSVVALGAMLNTSPPGQAPKIEWRTLGTGFFYGYKVKDDPDLKKREYAIYLVTAAHVVSEFRASGHGDLLIRINSKDHDSSSQTFNIPEKPPDGASTWFYHPGFNPISPSAAPGNDIAAVQINGSKIKELGAGFIANDEASADSAKLRSIGTSAGDGVFVLGFPMNLAGVQRNYVIVREGIIARISELLDHASPTFMLDSFVFPGNSGSPVILKPEVTAIQGTAANGKAYLVGVVVDYKPYTDRAISEQTHHPRIIFEENSGLADAIPMDRVDEAITAYRSR